MAGKPRKSRKPFGTKAESLLETSTFFVDRCLGKSVGIAVRGSGLRWNSMRTTSLTMRTTAWISEVGRPGWVVLTKDKAIRRNSVELQAVIATNARMFTLSGGNMTGEEIGRVFVDNRLTMRDSSRTIPRFIARVSASGVAMAYPPSPGPEPSLPDSQAPRGGWN